MVGMNPSARYKLFDVARIPVHADHSALVLLVLLLVIYGRGGPAQVLGSILIAGVAFVSLVGHELGHALAVRRLGYGQSQIVLGGLGGVCKWYGRPTRGDSVRIALAGPAASLLMGALSLALYLAMRSTIDGVGLLKVLVSAAVLLNLAWGLFNLLPIFPMDGGRALRSVLSGSRTQRRAAELSLKISGFVGLVVAVLATSVGQWPAALVIGLLLMQNYNEWQELNGASTGHR